MAAMLVVSKVVMMVVGWAGWKAEQRVDSMAL